MPAGVCAGFYEPVRLPVSLRGRVEASCATVEASRSGVAQADASRRSSEGTRKACVRPQDGD